MSKHTKGDPLNRAYKKYAVLSVILLLFSCAAVYSYSAYVHYKNQLLNSSSLVTSINKQMKISAEQYFQKLEKAAIIMLTEKEYAEFDASDTQLDKYDAARIEDGITKYLTKLSLMDNYCDFAIIYNEDLKAGILSSSTENLLKPDMYGELSGLIGENKTCWLTGIKDNYKRIYYLRRINDNAVFVSSVYTDELSNLFVAKQQLNDIQTYLVAPDGKIAYSSEVEAGENVPEKYIEAEESGSYTVSEWGLIQSVGKLSNGWRVITVLDAGKSMTVYGKTALASAGIALLALVILISAGIMSISGEDSRMSQESASRCVSDIVTGLCNAETAENLIADKIETCISGSTIMLALVKIHNYKLILENYGAAGVNEAMLVVSRTLTEMFGSEDGSPNIVGRTGDNEFVVFADFTEYDLFKAHDRLKSSLQSIDKRLKQCELASGRGMIKCAVGAAVYPDSSMDYDELYEYAKQALEEADENGAVKYVLHKKETADKGGQG